MNAEEIRSQLREFFRSGLGLAASSAGPDCRPVDPVTYEVLSERCVDTEGAR
jgi:hypothetical protein